MIALSAAVPLRIAELARHGDDYRIRLANEMTCGQSLIDGPCPCAGLADIIAVHADAIIRRDPNHGAALTFNAIARALAVGAYQPGGVTFAGQHWEAERVPPVVAGRAPGVVTVTTAGDVL